MDRTLLIVEDDDDIFAYYQILLREEGLRILRAADGRQGLALLDAGGPVDLILLDMVLPGMSGEEFFRALRARGGPATPVVACSVDERLVEPLRAIGELQGVFLKGDPGGKLVSLLRGVLGAPPAGGAYPAGA